MNGALLRGVALVACLNFQVAPANAADQLISGPVSSPGPFTEDDLVLLQLDADGVTLTEALGGYSSRAGLYLPVDELARLLDLAIYVDPVEHKASGWVITQGRSFLIDLSKGIARGEGQEIALHLGDAVQQNDEIYVRADLLQRLLPINLTANLSEMALRLRTREELPFKARMDRMNRQPTSENFLVSEPAEIRQPYRLISPPSFDLTLSADGGNRAPQTSKSYDLRMGGDLLFAGFELFAASDLQGRLDNLRLLFERKDPSGGGLAGPFGITRANIGDTVTPGLSLGPVNSAGRGLFVTSESLEQASIFDRTDLRGELPAGYQVELYVNEVLRGSELSGPDGRYAFTKIPLGFGDNVIRLVFYGPRGERREEVRRISVDGNQLAAGKSAFSLGLVEETRQVIEVNPAPDAVKLLLPGYGKPRAVARVSHGLGNGVTINGGAARFSPLSSDSRTLLTGGVLASLNGYSTQIDGAWDNSNASAIALGLAGRPAGVSFVARHIEYRGHFFDEGQPLGALADVALRRSTTFRSDFALGISRQTLPIGLTFSRAETVNQRTYVSGGLRTSLPLGRYLFSSGLDAQQQRGGAEPSQHRLNGSTEITGLVGTGWQLRSGSTYELLPKARLVSATMTADRELSKRFSMRLAAAHYFGARPTTAIQGGLTRQFSFAYLTVNSSYVTSTNDARIGLQLSFGGLFDPLRRRYRLTPPGSGIGGNLAIQAFEDANGNGSRDGDEVPVEGLRIVSMGRTVRTDADGHALAHALGNGPKGILEADTESIPDPYLRLEQPRLRFVPRPGRVATANLAFVRAGEVTIRTEFDRGGGALRGLSALGLRLMDENGDIKFEGRSEFDGSLLADGLQPGTYRISLDPEQASRLGIELQDNPVVTIPARGGFVGQVTVRVARATSIKGK